MNAEATPATSPEVVETQHGIAHSLAGFKGGFFSENKRQPTEQEIWNHAIRSWCDLHPTTTAMPADHIADAGKKVSVAAIPDGLPYGIIDPDYARIFTIARCLAWAEGYALMMHGSFTRDLDLLAVPWAEVCCEPSHLVRRIQDAAGLKFIDNEPSLKAHGRLAWTLAPTAFADPRFIDISVMPRAALSAAPTKEKS
jgi:hypothetical protein